MIFCSSKETSVKKLSVFLAACSEKDYTLDNISKGVRIIGERLIFHVDVNSAYLSWEATRRVKNGESDLRLIPSCIGGDPESRRGIVLAKSIPATKYIS